MRYTVFKALDKSASFFGIRGSYLVYALVGFGGAVLAAVTVSRVSSGVVGVIVFAALFAAVYLAVLAVQARLSERDREKWFAKRSLPDYLTVPPRPLRRYMAADISSVYRQVDALSGAQAQEGGGPSGPSEKRQ